MMENEALINEMIHKFRMWQQEWDSYDVKNHRDEKGNIHYEPENVIEFTLRLSKEYKVKRK